MIAIIKHLPKEFKTIETGGGEIRVFGFCERIASIMKLQNCHKWTTKCIHFDFLVFVFETTTYKILLIYYLPPILVLCSCNLNVSYGPELCISISLLRAQIQIRRLFNFYLTIIPHVTVKNYVYQAFVIIVLGIYSLA